MVALRSCGALDGVSRVSSAPARNGLAQPKLRTSPPVGNGWIYEVEFDGWRVQLHKTTRADAIYTKSGYHCMRRFKSLAAAVADLSVLSCLIDGEATARDEQGLPDFPMLQFRNAHAEALFVWAFDLLSLNGDDLRSRSSSDRKHRLE